MRALIADCREMIAEQIEYRELLRQMTMRDLLLRYKQTVMGFGWAVFMPLVNTAVFSVIFTRVAPLETPVAVPGVCVLRAVGLELLRLVAAVLGDLAHEQRQPGLEGLLPARDLSVLGGLRLPGRLRRRIRGPGGTDDLVPRPGRRSPSSGCPPSWRSTSCSPPAWRCCCRWPTCSTATSSTCSRS